MHRATILHNDGSTEYFFEEGCFITEWWNSADDPDVSVARARVPPGGTTRWHRLTGVIERYVVLEGEGLVEIGDAVAERVMAGSVVVIPAGVRQRITNTGAPDLIFLAICTPRFQKAIYQDLAAETAAGDRSGQAASPEQLAAE